MSIFSELKRRNVIRVGAAYAIVAWLLLQVADIVLGNIHAPDWVIQTFMLALALGFPIAVILAWAIELTPEGFRRDTGSDPGQSVAGTRGNKLDYIIIVALIMAAGFFAWDRLSRNTNPPAPPSAQAGTAATPESSEASIAVLPFVNMSADANQEYFSDGISEEILNDLGRIPDLKVAARTSTFAYKGSKASVAEIASALKVNHILEGSVRTSGDEVRITAELIQASDGFQLWSNTYDRKLDNIFAIQDDIAKAIADALKVKLALDVTSSGNLTGTTSLPAYEHYLRGINLWHQRTVDSLTRAFDEFNEAIRLDPNFAKAWAGLALNWAVYPGYIGTDYHEARQKGLEAADHALSIDPDNVEAMAAKGQVLSFELKDNQAAELFEQAIEINPSFATAYQWYGLALSRNHQDQKGISRLRRAQELDPLSRIIPNNLAWAYWNAGQSEEALRVLSAAVQAMPDYPDGLEALLAMKVMLHQCDDVLALGRHLVEIQKKTEDAAPVFLDLCQTTDPARTKRAVKDILQWSFVDFGRPDSPTLVYSVELIDVLNRLGELNAAVELFVKQWNTGKFWPGAVAYIRSKGFREFNCNPQIQAIYAKVKLPPEPGAQACP